MLYCVYLIKNRGIPDCYITVAELGQTGHTEFLNFLSCYFRKKLQK